MTKTGWQVWLVFAILVVALPARAQVVDDCTGQADGTLCRDMDDNPCTQAACDEEDCIQSTPVSPGAVCCTDGTNPDPPNTACPDTDGDICSIPACNNVGDCNQGQARMADGTECPDTDGQPSTHAACSDGVCDQTFAPDAITGAPALSTMGVALLLSTLVTLGCWRLRRAL